MSRKYQSGFFMPRGFANEGTWIYGKTEAIEEYLSNKDFTKCRYSCSANHNWFSTAKARARRLYIKDNANCPSHEIVNIDYEEIK